MTPLTRPLRALIAVSLLAALTALYAGALATGFLNDDYLFLEQAQRTSLVQSLTSLGPLGNYFRPVSRQIYFEALAPLFKGPLGFHLFNYAIFLGALALLADLLLALLPWPGVLAGLLYFAVLPFQRVNLMWVSCSQDLLALFFSLAAVALYRRARDPWAALAYLLAVFSKESALPLPLALAAWSAWIEPRLAGEAPKPWTRRLIPFVGVAVLWAATAFVMRARNPGAAAFLHFAPDHFLAAYVHQIQSLLGLEHWAGMRESLKQNGPAPWALLCLGAIAFAWLVPAREKPAAAAPAAAPPLTAGLVPFALVWLAAFGFVTGPVAATWSAYYYTLAAVGAALLVGAALRRMGPTAWLLLAGALLWWHAGTTGTRGFAIADRPWGFTSHLTSFYFERAAILTDTLGRQLRRLEPRPEPGTRFFFTMLPPWAGFQMGNGAQVRALYHDPSIESHFYSQFSESTAADRPCRFFAFDGRELHPLFGSGTDVFFQVGSDLALFGKLLGARHAFLRGLAAGEHPVDNLYGLGWTELWLGHRAAAERAWSAFGATDDSLEWFTHMRLARSALLENRDTLEAKRQLAGALRRGIGRPEAHAVLGELFMAERPKYGLLELKIAAFLKPDDWVARRGLVIGLTGMQLDQLAGEELARLQAVYPGWREDLPLGRAIATLQARGAGTTVRTVAEF